MRVYIEDPKDATRKLLELINEFGKVAGYKIDTQKSVAFLYSSNERSEREVQEAIPFTITSKRIESVQFSRLIVSNSLEPHGLQHARLPCPSPTPGTYSNSWPWVCDAIQPCHPLSSSSPPTFHLFQHQGLLQWVSSSHQVTKVLEFQF